MGASTADRYASASRSANLTPHMDKRSDADVLLAAGIAAATNKNHSAALALMRVLDGNMREAVVVLDHYAGMLNQGGRGGPRAERIELVSRVIEWMLNQRCVPCGGTGKLADHTCPSCHGAGIKPLSGAVPSHQARTALWLVDHMHEHARAALRRMQQVGRF